MEWVFLVCMSSATAAAPEHGFTLQRPQSTGSPCSGPRAWVGPNQLDTTTPSPAATHYADQKYPCTQQGVLLAVQGNERLALVLGCSNTGNREKNANSNETTCSCIPLPSQLTSIHCISIKNMGGYFQSACHPSSQRPLSTCPPAAPPEHMSPCSAP